MRLGIGVTGLLAVAACGPSGAVLDSHRVACRADLAAAARGRLEADVRREASADPVEDCARARATPVRAVTNAGPDMLSVTNAALLGAAAAYRR
jgi:hypothetical protein